MQALPKFRNVTVLMYLVFLIYLTLTPGRVPQRSKAIRYKTVPSVLQGSLCSLSYGCLCSMNHPSTEPGAENSGRSSE